MKVRTPLHTRAGNSLVPTIGRDDGKSSVIWQEESACGSRIADRGCRILRRSRRILNPRSSASLLAADRHLDRLQHLVRLVVLHEGHEAQAAEAQRPLGV